MTNADLHRKRRNNPDRYHHVIIAYTKEKYLEYVAKAATMKEGKLHVVYCDIHASGDCEVVKGLSKSH